MKWAIYFWLLSAIPVFIVPFGIALFYRRTFHKATYPYCFIISFLLYGISIALVEFEPGAGTAIEGSLLLGSILLAGASLRLYQVMMGRRQ